MQYLSAPKGTKTTRIDNKHIPAKHLDKEHVPTKKLDNEHVPTKDQDDPTYKDLVNKQTVVDPNPVEDKSKTEDNNTNVEISEGYMASKSLVIKVLHYDFIIPE